MEFFWRCKDPSEEYCVTLREYSLSVGFSLGRKKTQGHWSEEVILIEKFEGANCGREDVIDGEGEDVGRDDVEREGDDDEDGVEEEEFREVAYKMRWRSKEVLGKLMK